VVASSLATGALRAAGAGPRPMSPAGSMAFTLGRRVPHLRRRSGGGAGQAWRSMGSTVVTA